ncbi:MAG TPA: hypothetical protein VHN80_01340 [Kineosporiaceae bacterium]|nr:hypothetical protein [Kineosporiaceae bacterium]
MTGWRRLHPGLGGAGVQGGAQAVPAHHDVFRPEEFWDVVLGSGYRGTVDGLQTDQQHDVLRQLLHALRARHTPRLCADVADATARRASSD